MDSRAHSKRSSLTQRGLALLCVLFCLVSGCQQLVQAPAETDCDPELAELAMSLSADGEPNTIGAASAEGSAPVASAIAKAEPAPPVTAGKTEAEAPAKKIEAAAAAPAKKIESAAAAEKETVIEAKAKAEAPARAEVKKAEAVSPVKKAEAAAPSQPAAAKPAPAEKPAPVAPEGPAAGGGPAEAPAETVPKEGEPAKSIGPESIEETPAPAPTGEPKADVKPEDLTAIIIGGKEILISEPLPMKTLTLAPELKIPGAALDTTPLAAPDVGVEAPAAAAETAETADAGEGKRTKFQGLLGLGRSAIGYAGDHYIVLGSMALATPAMFIFARKKKIFRRAFRKMNLED